MSNDTTQPAFPMPGYQYETRGGGTDRTDDVPGMTYRQWLLGKALEGAMANPDILGKNMHAVVHEPGMKSSSGRGAAIQHAVNVAVDAVDTLLARPGVL